MAADQNYLRQLSVALNSLSETADAQCRVHVLQEGIADGDRDRVQASVSEIVQIEWIDLEAELRDRFPAGGPPRAACYRLLLSEVLPRLPRVIYLDADVIVRRPLTELWSTDLGGAPIAAVRDAYIPWMARDLDLQWRQLDLAPESEFFNSGVMLLSLDAWRNHEIGARAAALLARFSLPTDQDALNILLERNWAALHPTWNVQSYHLSGDASLAFAAEGRERLDVALADPAIVHFTGGTFNRPWQAPCGNPYRDEWLEHLDQTAWSGWRPKPAPRFGRALSRTKRALRVLLYGGSGAVR